MAGYSLTLLLRCAALRAGKALNPNAFTLPTFPAQGDSPQNGIRSPYGIDQTDLALRRRFNITERVKLDFRVEYFNLFNHRCSADMVTCRIRSGATVAATLGPHVLDKRFHSLAWCGPAIPSMLAWEAAVKTAAKRPVCTGWPALGSARTKAELLRSVWLVANPLSSELGPRIVR
jgi:hypothetical protein